MGNPNEKPKHTAGPWTVAKADADVPLFDVRLKGDDSTDDTLICQMYEPGGKGVQRANAALIAAAPEMLEALTYIHAALTSKKTEDACTLTLPAALKLEQAIAKARGES